MSLFKFNQDPRGHFHERRDLDPRESIKNDRTFRPSDLSLQTSVKLDVKKNPPKNGSFYKGPEVSPIECDVRECVVRTSDSLENLTF